jgi:hypothetical protein
MKKWQTLPALCWMCKHFTPAEEDEQGMNVPRCPAFPEGIPDNIMFGADQKTGVPDQHLEKAVGQTSDTVFEKDEGVTDEMVTKWLNEFERSQALSQRQDMQEAGSWNPDWEEDVDPNVPLPSLKEPPPDIQ